MRKTIFTLLMLAVAIGMSAHELLSNAEVDAQWRTKTISVKNGGQSPNVVMLLKAFNKALPTWVVGENGYACYESLTDVDQMSCCIWRRTNGHRIFAISLYEQHVMPQNLLCWYDYDPQTQTMTPERSPLDDYKKPFPQMEIGWTLPQKCTVSGDSSTQSPRRTPPGRGRKSWPIPVTLCISTIHIIHASVADHVQVDPQWVPFEFER